MIPEDTVITLYSIPGRRPSGKCAFSDTTRTDSPLMNAWFLSNEITLILPPTLLEPILLIPATLLPTL